MRRRGKQPAQGMVEYSLVLALVAVVAIVVLTVLGGTISSFYSNVVCSLGHSVCVGGPGASPGASPSPSPSPAPAYASVIAADSPLNYFQLEGTSPFIDSGSLNQPGTASGGVSSGALGIVANGASYASAGAITWAGSGKPSTGAR